ncbi:MAG: M23 family metallopeptidase [Vicinamibacterales bacterium]
MTGVLAAPGRIVALAASIVVATACGRVSHLAGPDVAPALACTGYEPQDRSPFVLPYPPGTAYLVLQGNCGPFTHWPGDVFKYGYDFTMPVGTPVHAARGGAVMAIEDRYPDGDGTPGEENFVFVRHDDGTIGRYFHLTRGGVRVTVGEAIAAGTLVGLSGNTGRTNGVPHLHFDVAVCPPTSCRTLPVVFRNTRPHPAGLVQGEVYEAW